MSSEDVVTQRAIGLVAALLHADTEDAAEREAMHTELRRLVREVIEDDVAEAMLGTLAWLAAAFLNAAAESTTASPTEVLQRWALTFAAEPPWPDGGNPASS